MTKEIIENEGMDPKTALEEFLAFVRSSKANLTHNGINFDINFLVQQVKKYLGWKEDRISALEEHLYRTAIDTAVFFKANILEEKRRWNEDFYSFAIRIMDTIAYGKYNLGVCCDQLDIDRSKITQHRALGDVELTNMIFSKLIESESYQDKLKV